MMAKAKCPTCEAMRDTRAKQCKKCQFRDNHPRLGTGKDWSVHGGTGYVTKCVDGKWVYQHRVVVERALGRKLMKDECIHHKNRDKTDNRLSNLEVMSKSEHNRQHILEAWRGTTQSRAKAMSDIAHANRRS